MNQICKVCGEPAAGFHFGAFTCEGCKSFFGRSYNNLSSISECKNNGKCIIDKKNRTTCKACRLRKCYTVGMSKGGSRYGRRSNWFKIHCLLQEQQQQAVDAAGKTGGALPPTNGFGDMATAAAVAAQQHLQQQRSTHMAQHMGGLLGYPGYLPEMSPFLSAAAAAATRHPGDSSAAAAALPFFNMMNGLPAPQSAYQLPPHLLFSGYHPGAAAAAAADAAYRSEMFQHRQSIDSLSESQRYSPAARSTHSSVPSEERLHSARQSPVLCVSGDEVQHSALSSQHSSAAASPISAAAASTHHIHSPIAIRATPQASPLQQQQQQQHEAALSAPLVNVTPPKSQPSSPVQHATDQHSEMHASFAAKMQSLSPVSVCSISAESLPAAPSSCNSTNAPAAAADDQDCPMDLSMKTSRSSVHSFDTSAGESDASEEELRQAAAAATRRKFYQLSEQESDASSDASAEMVKRQKLVAESQNYNGFSSNPTSLRGIFVCV